MDDHMIRPSALQPDVLGTLTLVDLAKLLDQRKSMLASLTTTTKYTSPPTSPCASLPRTSGSFDNGCEVGLDPATAAALFGHQHDETRSSYTGQSSNPCKLTPEERAVRIERYRAKKRARNFSRRISYQCRKKVADSRPRIRGRFARDDELGAVLPEERSARRVKAVQRSAEDLLADEVLV